MCTTSVAHCACIRRVGAPDGPCRAGRRPCDFFHRDCVIRSLDRVRRGLDNDVFRMFAAILLVVTGIVLAMPGLQERFSAAASPFGDWAESRFGQFSSAGVTGQFGVGVLLGAVWSPCAGPVLGAASLLASQGKDLGEVTLVMLLFGIGAALPLLALGLLSREVVVKLRGKLLRAGRVMRLGMGAILIVLGTTILTGYDKQAEVWLLNASPDWLTKLTASF